MYQVQVITNRGTAMVLDQDRKTFELQLYVDDTGAMLALTQEQFDARFPHPEPVIATKPQQQDRT